MIKAASKKMKLSRFMTMGGGIFISGLLLVLDTIRELFASADTSCEDESGETASGSLNYRTGKRDDGTDPYGWYDHE
tara:strand:- start:485 stop:715 length:231 start_codon:yes stop_codon:yes gene_type:complete